MASSSSTPAKRMVTFKIPPAKKSCVMASEAKYVLDHEGDVLLILSNPNAPFAASNQKCIVPSPITMDEGQAKKSEARAVSTLPPASHALDASSISQQEPRKEIDDVHFRLSSKHLICASKYFRNQFKGPPNSDPAGRYIVHAQDWDEQALLLVMQIIHGLGDQVPRSASLELVAKVAAIVNYYMCHSTCSFFYDTWISRTSFEQSIANGSGRDSVLSLFIGWALYKPAMFQTASLRVARSSRGVSLDSLGLPIPLYLIMRIGSMRASLLKELAESLKTILYNPSHSCSHLECAAGNLGLIMVHLNHLSIRLDQLESATGGYAVDDIIEAIERFRPPTEGHVMFLEDKKWLRWCPRENELAAVVRGFEPEGLTLSDFRHTDQAEKASDVAKQ